MVDRVEIDQGKVARNSKYHFTPTPYPPYVQSYLLLYGEDFSTVNYAPN